ncbi:MAG: hypothetical protein HRU15_20630 [Planctomycetes bacterium]|nr:hypothetical protein [Planctomycetota bacterium]
MKVLIYLALMLTSLLVLSGCARLAIERQVVWAQLGTPARIVHPKPVRILIPQSDGSWKNATAILSGMIAIDEPTLEYYQQLDHHNTGTQKEK